MSSTQAGWSGSSPPLRGPLLLLATRVSSAGGGLATAASVAVAATELVPHVAFVALGKRTRPRRATTLASGAARELEAIARRGGEDGARARGRLCWVDADCDRACERLAGLGRALGAAPPHLVVAYAPPGSWREVLDGAATHVDGALIRADMPEHRSAAALAIDELRARGVVPRLAARSPGPVGSRRSQAGLEAGGPAGRRARRLARGLVTGSAAGQALPLVLATCLLCVLAALLLVAIGSGLNAGARVQRAADLAALSAARSLRDDADRLLAPPRLPDGRPNPAHLDRGSLLARARGAALRSAERNGLRPARVRVGFPDAEALPPLRARVAAAGELEAVAIAEAAPPPEPGATLPVAAGGGYAGPLARRQGEPMRPDVAAAFDRMSAAARAEGIVLLVVSGYRSDAEQARLFARNPDPRWVARPGTSLHRCATEIDLGPPAAYRWLASNAGRFGFLRRYEWEPWHFGYVRGPEPCSAAGSRAGRGDGRAARGGLPGFVPAAHRRAIASAAKRWNVSGALLAAQLMAESGFDPGAVSSAGARGIAQFMPATAAAYGLGDPFDPAAAIEAQARLMSDLLRRFGAPSLALAAYNAGPGAVQACRCVPPYPETRAYVARVLALSGAGGSPGGPRLEVRLVA